MTAEDVARFEEKVDRSGGPEACHLWTAGTSGNGYGAFKRDGRAQPAHRVAYDQMIGPIPTGMHVCHRCDVPLCVNPVHLFLGTDADNVADKVSKVRQARGAKHRATSGRPKTSPHASQYRGVCWDKAKQKWQAQVTVAGRLLRLGYFVDEYEAACAYLLAISVADTGASFDKMKTLFAKG